MGGRDESGYHCHPDSSRFIMNTVRGEGRAATGLNRTSTVSNRGHIVDIRSSTVVNRSAAAMNSRISVDESCRQRRSILILEFAMHPDLNV